MTDAQALQAAVDATEAKLRADTDVAASIAARAQAWWELKRTYSWTYLRIYETQRAELLAHGHTEDDIKGSGAGLDSIRRAVLLEDKRR